MVIGIINQLSYRLAPQTDRNDRNDRFTEMPDAQCLARGCDEDPAKPSAFWA